MLVKSFDSKLVTGSLPRQIQCAIGWFSLPSLIKSRLTSSTTANPDSAGSKCVSKPSTSDTSFTRLINPRPASATYAHLTEFDFGVSEILHTTAKEPKKGLPILGKADNPGLHLLFLEGLGGSCEAVLLAALRRRFRIPWSVLLRFVGLSMAVFA